MSTTVNVVHAVIRAKHENGAVELRERSHVYDAQNAKLPVQSQLYLDRAGDVAVTVIPSLYFAISDFKILVHGNAFDPCPDQMRQCLESSPRCLNRWVTAYPP
nr:hypothetical protein CFP56_13442 [Quercus suber]